MAGDSYEVSGSSHQPGINGIYQKMSKGHTKHSCYTKGKGADARVLYWKKDSGQWNIAHEIGKGEPLAKQPNGSSPTYTPAPTSDWLVLEKEEQPHVKEEAVIGDTNYPTFRHHNTSPSPRNNSTRVY